MFKHMCFSAFAFLVPTLCFAATWTLNDVSILLPLPAVKPEIDSLLKADSAGAQGTLIPKTAYKNIPPLSFFGPAEDYKQLRAVAIRLDPCFSSTVPATNCRPQVRIVWQPILALSDDEAPNSIDAAIHTFYDLNKKDFNQLLVELSAFQAQFAKSETTLTVHPVALSQGVNGPFVQGLQKIILKYAGEKKLSRVTFMVVRGSSILWAFGGSEVSDEGKIVRALDIPRVERPDKSEVQTFFNRSGDGSDFAQSDVAPAPAGADTFNLLMRDTVNIVQAVHEKEMIEGINSIYRIENPRFHSSETMDCVSCHVAQSARHMVGFRFADVLAKTDPLKFAFVSAQDISNTSNVQSHTRNMRAFGYFGRDASISQRTINESAVVVDELNALKTLTRRR